MGNAPIHSDCSERNQQRILTWARLLRDGGRAEEEADKEAMRIEAAYRLMEFGKEAAFIAPILIDVVLDISLLPISRVASMKALCQIAPEAEATQAILAWCLRDEEEDLRQSAAACLGDIRARRLYLLPELHRLLDDPVPTVAVWARYAIFRIYNDPTMIHSTISDLYHHQWEAREEAAKVLDCIGAPAEAAMPALEALLETERNFHVRDATKEALSKIRRRCARLKRPSSISSESKSF